MCYLLHRDHTDPLPPPQKPLGEGDFWSLDCRLALVASVRWRNECICAVFENLGRQKFREALCRRVKVVEHRVAPTPPHQADGVLVQLLHD